MANFLERVRTFDNWPLLHPNADRLAFAGFYYLGHSDMVRCCFCGLTVGLWQPEDDPLEEHARLNPQCPFLMQHAYSFDMRDLERDAHIIHDVEMEEVEFPPFTFNQQRSSLQNVESWGRHVHQQACNQRAALQIACAALNLTPHTISNDVTQVHAATTTATRCCICLDSHADIVLLPCCHICTCGECVQRVLHCPICKSEVIARTKVYFS